MFSDVLKAVKNIKKDDAPRELNSYWRADCSALIARASFLLKAKTNPE